jgi:hypothetical protein
LRSTFRRTWRLRCVAQRDELAGTHPASARRSHLKRMTIDDGVRLLEAATKLFGVFVWPAVLVFVLVRFGPALRDLVASLGEFSLKGPGFEASAKRKQAEAAANLTAAAVSHPEAGATPEARAREARAAFDVVAEVATPRVIRRAGKSTVLWVDDTPSNNEYERKALEALGVSFVLATSTDEAFEKVKRQSFDAIISDMGRPPSAAGPARAGLRRTASCYRC